MRLGVKFIVVLLLFSFASSGQAKGDEALLDSAFKNSGLFVGTKPGTHIGLAHEDMWRYAKNLKEFSKAELDTVMFHEIIEKSKTPDTTPWTKQELRRFILVGDRNESVSVTNTASLLGVTDKKLIRQYEDRIRQFNQSAPFDKDIYYFSRPVFDKSRKFAIVQYDNGHSGLGGGGAIILYQRKGDTWSEVGSVSNWRY